LENTNKEFKKQINEQTQELIEVNDDFEKKTLEAQKLSKELTTTKSQYHFGIIIASICVLIVNIVIGFVAWYCWRRASTEIEDSQEKRFYEGEERMKSLFERQNHEAISVERSRDSKDHSPFPCFSKSTYRILSKRETLIREENRKHISETQWKIQNYFQGVYEEQINETPSESPIQSQNESYVHQTASIRKSSRRRCCSEP